jgi:hypothetical protein
MAYSTDSSKDTSRSTDTATKLPLVDLEASIKTVMDIDTKALETASMQRVATELGYASPTSSPFYRRISAARTFGLLSQKSSLTSAASDYIRPHDEGTRSLVLKAAIMGIPYYRTLINLYTNKKLNVDLVANAVAKDCHMDDDLAQLSAKAFEASLKFAGMIGDDGVVRPLQPSPAPTPQGIIKHGEIKKVCEEEDDTGKNKHDGDDTQRHVIYLDKSKVREFSFTGPLEVTRAEFERICKWLEFTMLIVETKQENQP